MLEEIGFEYAVKKMDLSKGDQFKEDFKEISPFSKIPAIIDYSNNKFYNQQTTKMWKSVTDKGMIIVNSAGNQGFSVAANPGFFATVVDENGNLILGGKMLIVGGVDQNNNLYSWSNQAGHLCMNIVDNKCNDKYKVSDFYVLAPGATYSTNGDGGYQVLYGTSMAAPIVTGQIAILHQMWPHMKGENLVKLVLNTADTNINGYDVNIHGQGMLDLNEATLPQGAVGIPTTGRVDGTLTSLNNTYFATGSTSAFSSLSNLKSPKISVDVSAIISDLCINLTALV